VLEWIVLLGIFAAAWYANAGRIVRMYFMTDNELRKVRSAVDAYVAGEVSSREDRTLVTAVIAIESGGNPAAKSPAGAVGLMQIMQPALDDYNAAHASDYQLAQLAALPQANVRVGYWYLRKLELDHGLSRFDALRAYNVGIGHVRRDPSGELGATYAAKVLAYAQRLEVIA
jgi:soluble lytic murein transglycosylase-like protein